MRLLACIAKQEVTLLVDNGSSHNFTNSIALERVGLHSEEEEPFVVRVANGERLLCSKVPYGVKMIVQGVKVRANLHVLSLEGVDIVLGNAWLRSLGKVVHDYAKMTIEFQLGGRQWTG